MRFVPVKTEQQQAELCVHRARQAFVEARIATINRLRGLLSEFGIVLPQKAEVVRREAAAHLEALPGDANLVIGDLLSELDRLDKRVAAYDNHVTRIARTDDRARRLMQLASVGPTTASALVAMIGKGNEFSHGRQLAAWIGWCRTSTARAAKPGSGTSPRPAMGTCARCSAWAVLRRAESFVLPA